MCAAVAKTSPEDIVLAAREIIERGGPDAVTMNEVARLVGVKAPSLYKRYADRSALLRAVQVAVIRELQIALEKVPCGEPREVLTRMSVVYRGYARRNPESYKLLFNGVPEDQATRTARVASARRVLTESARLVGDARALPAARTMIAFLHGFIAMELHGAFRTGGRVEDAFRFGMQAVLMGVDAAVERRR